MSTPPVIAAIVPCYNEEVAVGQVIADLRAAVPEMAIYVYDNNSSDRTAAVAAAAGAIVRREERKGKGNVVRRAFADIDADIYVMIDGDDTYDAAALPEMIRTLQDGPYDHVLGVRTQPEGVESAYRSGHELGNKGFNLLVGSVFGDEVGDMLSGYRVMSRRFVKSFPAASREFEIETELTVHVMSLRVPQAEVAVGFKDRPAGSESKLRTYHDGFRILNLVIQLIRHERPLFFYGIVGAVFLLVAVILGIPLIVEFAQTGLVPRFPTALVTVALGVAGGLAWAVGLVLDGVLKERREASRLAYLRYSAASR
ncbi:glycosyltransferase [Microbacterium indicum]|uniref:glycosyltransferase n=1 Tax=Microbacterium indicum TaxID=358100 RepID=UPI0004900F91|nr:glycosyltransferase [Microbacterium indicum]